MNQCMYLCTVPVLRLLLICVSRWNYNSEQNTSGSSHLTGYLLGLWESPNPQSQ